MAQRPQRFTRFHGESAAIQRCLGRRRVQVDAADDVSPGRVEHGEREAGPLCEVGGMPLKVGEVPLERHAARRRPPAIAVTGSGADVIDVRGPVGVIGCMCCGPSGSRWKSSVANDTGGRKPSGTQPSAVMGPTASSGACAAIPQPYSWLA
jgi:hypothetical protein